MKKILFTFILCLVTLFSMAQSMSVASFEYDEKDLTANTAGTIVRDQNDEKCALIRIQTTAKGFSFDVGALGVTKTDDNHVGEVWVDGKKLGTIPDVFKGVLIGSRKVTLKKEGYADKVVTAEVKEGETTVISGALEKIASDGVVAGGGVSNGTSTSVGGTLEFNFNGVKFVMVPVQGGTFTMGATAEQGSDAYSDEKPAHSVTLSSYYIGQTEVTQELWTAVMGSNPSFFKGTNLPVEYVTWNDCQTFITKLNSATGKRFRLPTEAEWEYAARGGNKSRRYKYSGSNDVGSVAWYDGNSGDKTHPVATKSPNELGIYDMSGNVWEWCQDWYESYSSRAQTNPTGPSSGSNRVRRGGSWCCNARNCRSSNRYHYTPSCSRNILGLRLVLSE